MKYESSAGNKNTSRRKSSDVTLFSSTMLYKNRLKSLLLERFFVALRNKAKYVIGIAIVVSSI